MADLILFCDPSSFSQPKRDLPLTYRLALPSGFSEDFRFHERSIWIVVIAAKEAFLHAKLFVDYEELLERLETKEKYLFLEGSISESKYITSPDSLLEKKADVTGIISDHFPGFYVQSLPEVSECPEELTVRLDNFVLGIQRTYLSVNAVPKAVVSDLLRGLSYSEFRYKEDKFESLLRDSYLKAKRRIPVTESFTTREIGFPYGSLSLLIANEVEKHFKGKLGENNLEKAMNLFSPPTEEGSSNESVEVVEEESSSPPPLEELDPKDISFRVSLMKVSEEKRLSKIRTERAERHHQEILKHLAERLKGQGFEIFCNIKIDLAIVQNNSIVIFEIKSTTPKNYLDQSRNAVVQLLENEFLYSPSYNAITKVAVFEHLPPEGSKAFVEDFLEFTDIRKVYYDRTRHTFVHLDGLMKELK